MAGSPKYKIYRDGEYIGCLKYAEDAAAAVSMAGGVVKYGHKLVVWREGSEYMPAGESYDTAADIMRQRVDLAYQATMNRLNADAR